MAWGNGIDRVTQLCTDELQPLQPWEGLLIAPLYVQLCIRLAFDVGY